MEPFESCEQKCMKVVCGVIHCAGYFADAACGVAVGSSSLRPCNSQTRL